MTHLTCCNGALPCVIHWTVERSIFSTMLRTVLFRKPQQMDWFVALQISHDWNGFNCSEVYLRPEKVALHTSMSALSQHLKNYIYLRKTALGCTLNHFIELNLLQKLSLLWICINARSYLNRNREECNVVTIYFDRMPFSGVKKLLIHIHHNKGL